MYTRMYPEPGLTGKNECEYMNQFPLIHNMSCMIMAVRIVLVMRTNK